jgi:hypothetical protein
MHADGQSYRRTYTTKKIGAFCDFEWVGEVWLQSALLYRNIQIIAQILEIVQGLTVYAKCLYF